MVWSVIVLGFLSFIVWAHHMYLTGMGPVISTFFQTTTVLISIPSVILLTSLIISMWGGSIRFTVPMLWATAFIPMFGIGGLTGLAAGLQLGRSSPSRYLLRDWALPLCGRSGNSLRSFCRRLSLVSEDYRALHEYTSGAPPLLAFAHLHQPPVLPDVDSGNGWFPPPLV